MADVQKHLDKAIAAALDFYGGQAAVAIAGKEDIIVAGDDTYVTAWSTIKVPIAIAALRDDPSLYSTAVPAIVSSDNDATSVLWKNTDPESVNDVLAEGGLNTRVNTNVRRPEFSYYGLTAWTTSQQAVFAGNLGCIEGSRPVEELMGRIVQDQSEGIGTLPGARFKGGWGPDVAGLYVLRQLGLVKVPTGDVAMAITAKPSSGSYTDAQEMATTIAQELAPVLADFPTAAC